MINSLDQVVHRTTNSSDTCNVLYYPYNGIFEYLLSKVPHFNQLYSNYNSPLYENPSNSWPENLKFYNSMSELPETGIDFVLINHRSQSVSAEPIADYFHCPLVIIDHETTAKWTKESMIKYNNSQLPRGATLVATETFVGNDWLYDWNKNQHYNSYGFEIRQEIGHEKEKDIIVVGDYNIQDNYLLKHMLDSAQEITGIGYNGNLTDPYFSFEELEDEIYSSKISIMFSEPNKPPLLALMAASLGTVVITNKTKWTEKVFKHDKNAILFDSVVDMKSLVKGVLNDEDKIERLVEGGYKIINTFFDLENFSNNWGTIINSVKHRIYER